MAPLFWILVSTFVISLIAFIGALTLFLKKELLDKILLLLVSFSAGALMGGSFFHLIPEAIIEFDSSEKGILKVFLYLLLGFCVFFALEQFISWHHEHGARPTMRPYAYLVLLSDSLHNFIDGLTIAASFIVSFPIGLATVLAVALHEIPQEIGDYGVLIYGGVKRVRALFLNFFAASTVILGGIAGFLLSEKIGNSIVFLLPFAAGNFIYIAASDLIPEIKQKLSFKKSLIHFSIFLSGLLIMLVMRTFIHE